MTAASASPAPPHRHRPGHPWARFRSHRRGFVSLCLLTGLFLLSLAAELVCNDKPLVMRLNGRLRFPAFVAYTQDTLLNNGVHTRMTDYRAFLATHQAAVQWTLMAPFEAGARQTFSAADLEPHRRIELALSPHTHAAAVQIDAEGATRFSFGDTAFFSDAINRLPERIRGEPALADAIARRLANETAPAFDLPIGENTLALAPFTRRQTPPDSVRVLFRSPEPLPSIRARLPPADVAATVHAWPGLPAEAVDAIIAAAGAVATGEWVPPIPVWAADGSRPLADVTVTHETVSWPFRPVPGHPMGFDNAGRDVFARIFYALRTSLSFGLALVVVTLLLGIVAGAIQGYFAGWVDITGQRFTEIWSALPFLYVIILLGNILGRSFSLLLICYAIFNWIGIATYVRAEFLRLRGHAFVDAARCQGLSGLRIMFRHILPNALTPLITLLPFALVGAIGSLAVLDYLGFGLPPGSPSWGELLNQAQVFRNAWWLIVYPSLALFVVMLLGVFIGEGLRDALDPRPYSRLS